MRNDLHVGFTQIFIHSISGSHIATVCFLHTAKKFPLDVKSIIKSISKCKISSYIHFAKSFGISVDDVIKLCSSKTGCTHYDVNSRKYLILYNNSYDEYNVKGRQLWTLAHELAHVVLQHPLVMVAESLIDSALYIETNPIIEDDADYFAAQILSPVSLHPALNITSPLDVEHVFGLSAWAFLKSI